MRGALAATGRVPLSTLTEEFLGLAEGRSREVVRYHGVLQPSCSAYNGTGDHV